MSTAGPAIGVDAGGTKTAAVLVERDGAVLAREVLRTPAEDERAIVETVIRAAEAVATPEAVGVGIAAAGMVDLDGVVLYAPNLAWRDEPLAASVGAALDVPVIAENDVNAAAWGEFRHGAGRGSRQMFMVSVGTGIGVSPVAMRTPMGFAMSAGTLSKMTGGRFILGIGSGQADVPSYRRNWNVRGTSTLGLMRDYLTVIRALVRGETVDYTGPSVELHGAKLGINPPPQTPVYLTALGPEMLKLGGEARNFAFLGDGTFLTKPGFGIFITVGSANSSNSVRLVEVALDAGARTSYRVDKASEIDPAWLDGATTVGVTSGASVPEILVRDVLELLAQHGFGTVEEVRTATEDLMFSLPRELRADLKASGATPERPRREGRRSLDVQPA